MSKEKPLLSAWALHLSTIAFATLFAFFLRISSASKWQPEIEDVVVHVQVVGIQEAKNRSYPPLYDYNSVMKSTSRDVVVFDGQRLALKEENAITASEKRRMLVRV